jgi:hypothetical protein
MVRLAVAGGRVSPAEAARAPRTSARAPRHQRTRGGAHTHLTLQTCVRTLLLAALVSLLPSALPASAAPTVWVAPSYQRVKPDAPAGTAAEISICAAQGEWESAQLIVRGPATNVRVAAPSSALTVNLYQEHYHTVTTGSGTYATQVNRPDGPGAYPDALLPMPTGFDVASGQNQPVWVDVFAPRGLTPGLYTIPVTVTANEGAKVVSVKLTVWNFALPVKPALKSCFLHWNVRRNVAADQLLLANRIMPISVDLTQERRFIDTLGLNSMNAGFWARADETTGTMLPAPSVSQIQAAVATHQQDLYFYNYSFDEILGYTALYSGVKSWARNLHAAGVDNLVTVPPITELMDDGSGTGRSAVDAWVELPKQYDAAKVNQALAKGDEVWSYNCLQQDDYSPKWQLDYPFPNWRLQPGMLNWQLGMTGLLYWRTDYWSSTQWDSVEAYGASYPAEGLLFYKLPDGSFAGSIRLKWLRDGADDFDYLTLLNAAGQRDWAKGVVGPVATDWRNWSHDPAAIEAARRQLGERISGLSSPHTLSVTASASPAVVASGASASLSATAADSLGHGVASWSWSDGGAGGSFSPSASLQNPTYLAAANTTGASRTVTLTVSATCNGSSPIINSASTTLTVQSAAHTLSVSAGASPSTLASGGTASLSASATDSLGHATATWSWSDGGAGGSFSPSLSAQNPLYTAPVNTTDSARRIALAVTATCAGPPAISGSASTAVSVDPAAHTLSVSASASPTTVGSAGSASLFASATDSRGHAIIGWQWSDGGAGGSFAPSPNVSSPAYTAAGNTTGAASIVTLTVTAVCNGPAPLTGSAVVSITVQSVPLSLPVEAGTPVPSVVPSESTADLSATTSDSAIDQVASWRWDDAGANGEFLPSATVRNPQYRAPRNATGRDMHVVLIVMASCSEPLPMTGLDSTSVIVQPAPHALAVSASAEPRIVTWKGRSQLYAAASDTFGHRIAQWSWSDNRAGGSFSPSARVQNPTDRVPSNATAATTTIILSVRATCDGPSPLTATGYLSLIVQPKPGLKTPSIARVADGVVRAASVVVIHDSATGSVFSDLPVDYWASGAIEACGNAGILSGFPDGSYRPDMPVGRDQAAVYLARAVAGGDELVPAGPPQAFFSDLPTTHWAYRYVEYARERGIVDGFPDGRYHPAEAVNRAEMAAFISRSVVEPTGEEGIESYQPPDRATFSDLPATHWAYRYVEFLAERGIADGYQDGAYRPAQACTRAEAAVYLARAFKLAY